MRGNLSYIPFLGVEKAFTAFTFALAVIKALGAVTFILILDHAEPDEVADRLDAAEAALHIGTELILTLGPAPEVFSI